ncbi:MAG: UDP-N-acetylmuramate dehydrogenase [Chloroflexi bacterium]|nr:UDP-N-acetylmuramate dehydrogenase [Chloroflexota bacterium]
MTDGTFGTRNERLAPLTSLRIGGPADFFVRVTSLDDLKGAVRVARRHELPTFILGRGTNVLVADRGIRGVVLENAWSETEVEGVTINASSGTPLAHVAAVAARSGILGLEWLATIPGTVGGAVHGNAGAFGSDTAEALVDAVLMDLDGETWTVARDELGFAYRTSALQGTPTVVVRARLRGRPGERREAVARIKEMVNERAAKQPLAQPNTGSIFRNPVGEHAGRLIDAAGLKGARIGGAMVSERHANFIVNTTGMATAADVRALIDRCQTVVQERFGTLLVPEVEFVGEW